MIRHPVTTMNKIPSFQKIEQFSYCLIGLIPLLLAVYLMISMETKITTTILLIAEGAFLAQLMGFIILHRFGQQLEAVRDQTERASTAEQKVLIEVDENAPHELTSIVDHVNAILTESEKSSRNFQEMITKLMIHSRDIEGYQKKLKEEGISRYRLSRYVSHDLLNKIINSDQDTPLQNKKQTATILFADIRSFTTISEDMAPEQVIGMLNEHFDAMVKIIFKHNGVLDKFVGDELMATFGVLNESGQGALNALNAAIAMQHRITELMKEFKLKGYPTFAIGIGINTGEVVMGNVGSKNRMDYTVIGDTVNVAARLEQLAKGGCIMVGEETYNSTKASYIQMQLKGEFKVKNRTAPVKCYQVIK